MTFSVSVSVSVFVDVVVKEVCYIVGVFPRLFLCFVALVGKSDKLWCGDDFRGYFLCFVVVVKEVRYIVASISGEFFSVLLLMLLLLLLLLL